VKVYVAAVEALRKKERGDETRFTHLMPSYAETGRNRLTLRITLLCKSRGASIED